MASISLKKTKAGKDFYEIRCHVGRDRPTLSTRWYPPEGWSQKSIEKELNKVAAEFERKCQNGEVLSRSEQAQKDAAEAQKRAEILTLRQYGERVFMPAKGVTASRNTISSFQSNLDRYIYPALGDLKLPEITPAQITALLLEIQSSGKACATVVKVYTILSTLFKMAYMGDAIPVNPMDKVERPKPRKDEIKKDSVDAYTAEELCFILECLEKEPLKWRTMVHLLIDTGLRRGECCALKWENIDFQKGTISIAGNLCYTPRDGVYLDTPKNAHIRKIDVGNHVLELLRQLRLEQSQSCMSQWVFTQEGSPEVMHPQSPTRYLNKFAKKYGIKDLHPHKLRHSFASVAITNGADIASVSEKLGHSDKAVTLRMYTHADEESIKRAGDIFRNALSKEQKRITSKPNEVGSM